MLTVPLSASKSSLAAETCHPLLVADGFDTWVEDHQSSFSENFEKRYSLNPEHEAAIKNQAWNGDQSCGFVVVQRLRTLPLQIHDRWKPFVLPYQSYNAIVVEFLAVTLGPVPSISAIPAATTCNPH